MTYTTQFGSLDNTFKPHHKRSICDCTRWSSTFLEHKLFEKDNDEDLFTAFANDNAQVNAFTSFDRTSYLFSATDQVERNILRLLDMVETPYFQKETVDKKKELLLKKLKCIKNNQDIKLCSIHYVQCIIIIQLK